MYIVSVSVIQSPCVCLVVSEYLPFRFSEDVRWKFHIMAPQINLAVRLLCFYPIDAPFERKDVVLTRPPLVWFGLYE